MRGEQNKHGLHEVHQILSAIVWQGEHITEASSEATRAKLETTIVSLATHAEHLLTAVEQQQAGAAATGDQHDANL